MEKKNRDLLGQSIRLLLLVLVITLCLNACTQLDVFEKNISIPKNNWDQQLQPKFEFAIKDTSAAYKLFLVLRHTDAYRYNNIWLKVGTQAPGDTVRNQKFDVQLGTDAKGWYGTGMDDIWEYRSQLTNGPVKFIKAGNYRFSVSQLMRENPLPNILSVGIRVEKVK